MSYQPAAASETGSSSMKDHLRKTLQSAAILTFAFAVVIFAATLACFRNSSTLVIFGSVVMAIATIVSARIWSKPSSDSEGE